MKNYHFRSKDLPESAFLYCSNQKLIELQEEFGKVYFVFEDKAACEELTHLFWSKQTNVDAMSYATAIRILKDMIFNRERR